MGRSATPLESAALSLRRAPAGADGVVIVCACRGAESARTPGDARDIRRHLTRTKTENNNNLLLTDTRLKKTRTVRTWGVSGGERGPRAAGEGWKWRGGMIGVVGEMGESGRVKLVKRTLQVN